ncbi:MAG: nucleoside monophosphate kinase [Rickettsiaceae bacterium]|nr:nucleoside monophosphate kinase [Rickettsiaceae bacterium]
MLVIFLGPPGSGKGTQAGILSRKLGYKHVSTGDLLRQEVQSKSALGEDLSKIMGSGGLVPDEIVNSIVKTSLNKPEYESAILDGYPRTISQVQYLQDGLRNDYSVFHFDIDTKKLKARIEARFNCVKCNHIYNKNSHPPKVQGICDICGGTEFNIRTDDNAESLLKRVDIYNAEIASILEYYKSLGKLHIIDATLPMEEISEQILNHIERSTSD